MKYFYGTLDECGLMDLDFMGSKFTWFKNFSNRIFMWERLDRAVGTSDCLISILLQKLWSVARQSINLY